MLALVLPLAAGYGACPLERVLVRASPLVVSLLACAAEVSPAEDPAEALLLATSFEPASPACNGWTPDDDASAIRSVPPRTGTYACKLCASDGVELLALTRSTGPLEPGRYALRAWARSRPGTPAPAAVVATVDADAPAGSATAVAALAPAPAWSALEVPLELPDGAREGRVRIHAVAERGECLLVDDVALVRTP